MLNYAGPLVIELFLVTIAWVAIHTMRRCSLYATLFIAGVVLINISSVQLFAAAATELRGKVTDPLGTDLFDAKVELLRGASAAATTSTGPDGTFVFSDLTPGRYEVRVEAEGFTPQSSGPVFLSSGASVQIELSLQIAPLQQQIVVSATATEVPESQTGASVAIIGEEQLRNLNKVDLLEALRQVPGLQVAQTGQRGGTTSVFIRGANANFTKVLLDGIPANDIGGNFEFGNLANADIGRLEILRGANSILYGTDALGGVVNVTTRRGYSDVPEFRYSVDGGNFHTLRDNASVAGARGRFDYFSGFARFDTQNSIPNNAFHNATYAGNFGFAVNPKTELRLTLRNTVAALGLPGAFDLYAIADDSSQKERNTDASLTLQNQTTGKWHNLLRVVSGERRYYYSNPSPSGIPSDPFGYGANYVGQTVTIRGANGFVTSGRAILDFGGKYPQLFDADTKRRSIYAQSDYRFAGKLLLTSGFRYEHEYGFTRSSSRSETRRDNFSYFLEGQASLRQRFYANLGVGLEENAVFQFAATPRVSLAYYLRRPATDAFFGSTKLRSNFGTGIKEPSIFNEGASLYKLLSNLAQGPNLISKFGISPIKPERSRSFDAGLEQGLWGERGRVRLTFFDNRFFDLTEFVRNTALPQLGVPPDVAAASGFGAAVNSGSYRSKGVELEGEAHFGRGLIVRANYDYLDAVVTQSLSSSALRPAFNPLFPKIAIGAFGPLVGNRPFRRAPHSGSLWVDYSRGRFGVNLAGYFVGRQDDSTFLAGQDEFFGNSLLLPNQNLNAGYQQIDWSGRWSASRISTFYISMENALSQHYHAAFGYPALPLTVRAGVQFTLGGEGWGVK